MNLETPGKSEPKKLGFRGGRRRLNDVIINKVLAAAGLVLLSGIAYGNQILLNPDFESGLMSPWATDNSYQTGNWTVINSGCESGTHCLTGTGNIGLVQTFGGIPTASLLGVTFWVHPDSATPGQGVTAALLYSGGTDYITVNPTHGTWDFVNLTPSLRAADTLIGVEVFGYSGYSVELDNFSILASVPEPGTMWLLAAGLGALFATSRLSTSARRGTIASR